MNSRASVLDEIIVHSSVAGGMMLLFLNENRLPAAVFIPGVLTAE